MWRKAVDLAVLAYSITEKFPKSELYGITNQMRRSAVSISSNIAEGFKRSHKKEKLQFYNIAYGSTAELESQIEVSYKLNFLDNQDYQKLNTSVVEIGKMIDGLIKSQSKPPKSYILNSIFFLVLLSSISYILNPYPILAAQLNFASQAREIGVDQQFQVDLFLDTANEEINAVEGKIVFPTDLLELKDVRDGNSIINFWIERPRAKNGEVPFSGIIPGGYMDKKGPIFSIIFQSIQEGRGSIEIRDIKVLLNDGKGTEANTTISNLQLIIRTSDVLINDVRRPEIEDNDPPEIFTPEIASDPTMFDGKYFLVFATQDKGLGIDHYEIKEAREFRIWKLEFGKNKNWIIGENPYLLKDQKLKSYIYVKAIDKAGNERIAVVEPRYPMKWYEVWWIWGIIIVMIFISYFELRNSLSASPP